MNFYNDIGNRPHHYNTIRNKFYDGDASEIDLFNAIRTCRMLVPVEAYIDKSIAVNRSSSIGVIFIQSPDNRKTLPVFTDINIMKKWYPKARPILMNIKEAIIYSLSQGGQLTIIDPGTKDAYLLRRPAMLSIVDNKQWEPSYNSLQTKNFIKDFFLKYSKNIDNIILESCTTIKDLRGGKFNSNELCIKIQLKIKLNKFQLKKMIDNIKQELRNNKNFLELVDSVELKIF